MTAHLDCMSILVTRPKLDGIALCEKISALGGVPILFPTLEIIPLANNEKSSIKNIDLVIFVSRNAAMHGAALFSGRRKKIAAIGEGTALFLQSMNFKDILFPPKDWTSEGLLALPELHNVAGKKIVIVCGKGGRETLEHTLITRGANVFRQEVYQRRVPQYPDISRYSSLFHLRKINIIVSTSGESLHNLLNLLGKETLIRILSVPIVVVSQRLVELAKTMGFNSVFLAANASHNAIIETLCLIQGIQHDHR